MTVTQHSAQTLEVIERPVHNSFELSLGLGFSLDEDTIKSVANAMRQSMASVDVGHAHHITLIGRTPQQRAQALRELFDFLPAEKVEILVSSLRSNVEYMAIFRCPNDVYYTLYVEHS